MLPELIRERTEQILTLCRKSVIAVKLSLDGMEEMHDALREERAVSRRSWRHTTP